MKGNDMNEYSVNELERKVIEVALTLTTNLSLPLNEVRFTTDENLYGRCTSDGTIYVKVQFKDGERVPEMEVWRTLAHELAHLIHFNHDEDFWELNRVLVNTISGLINRKIRPEVAFLNRKKVIY